MTYLLITVPLCVLSFFLGFYANLVLKILVDSLNALMGLKNRQDVVAQQQEFTVRSTPTPVQFVEPMTVAELEALETEERIAALNSKE